MRAGLIFLIVLMLGPTVASLARDAAAPATAADAPTQVVRVIDGDTVEIDGRLVQIYGVDAPELGQICMNNDSPWYCGLSAAFDLRKLISIEKNNLVCTPWGGESETPSAVCKAGEIDVASRLIETGLALATPTAFPNYKLMQEKARKTGLGLWRGRFVPPPNWREGTRLTEEEKKADKSPAQCPLKAFIDIAGVRSLHVPTDPGYDKAVAPAGGQSYCFFSDEDSRLAGWTK